MKIIKIVGVAVAAIVALVLLAVLALPLWIGPVVKPVAGSVGSAKTGTTVHLGEFSLNQYCGQLTVGDLQLWNPEGFDEKMAFTLGRLHVEVEPMSVLSDTIVVKEVEIRDVYVSYLSDQQGRNNFDLILEKVKGGAEAQSEPASPPDAEPVEAAKAPDAQPAAEPQDEKSSKKVIIDRISISGVSVRMGPITLPLPPITLTGIGRESDGIAWESAWQEISAAVMQKLGVLGGSLKDLGGNLKDFGLEQSGKAMDALKQIDLKGAGKAVDAVGEGANQAVDALKGLFK